MVKGKIAIVTGAASGIGHAVVTRLINEGGKAVIADINEDAGKKAAEEFNANKSEKVALFYKIDVSKWKEWINLFDKAKETFGRIDILVNGAGIRGGLNVMLDDSLEEPDFAHIVNTDLLSASYGMKLAFRHMRRQEPKGGAIVNIASVSSAQPVFNIAVYAAAKSGIVSLTRSMAQVGPLFDINVNAVNPSATQTGMTADSIGLIPDAWWSPMEDVVNACFRGIYDPKLNGAIFSCWPEGVKQESYEKYHPVFEAFHQAEYQKCKKSLEQK